MIVPSCRAYQRRRCLFTSSDRAWPIEISNYLRPGDQSDLFPSNATLVCVSSDIKSAIILCMYLYTCNVCLCPGTDISVTVRPVGVPTPRRVFPRLVALSLGLFRCGVKKGFGWTYWPLRHWSFSIWPRMSRKRFQYDLKNLSENTFFGYDP